MSNLIMVRGANFSNTKIRTITYEDVVIDTVHNGVLFLNNTQSGLTINPLVLNESLSTDYADMAPFDQITLATSLRSESSTYKFAQVSIPNEAFGICGISTTTTNTNSGTALHNAFPLVQRKSDGTIIATDANIRWYTNNVKTSATTDSDFEANNINQTMFKHLKVLSSISGINASSQYIVRLIEFSAMLHSDATKIVLAWVAPKTITSPSAASPGGATLGVGMAKPKLKWIFE